MHGHVLELDFEAACLGASRQQLVSLAAFPIQAGQIRRRRGGCGTWRSGELAQEVEAAAGGGFWSGSEEGHAG